MLVKNTIMAEVNETIVAVLANDVQGKHDSHLNVVKSLDTMQVDISRS